MPESEVSFLTQMLTAFIRAKSYQSYLVLEYSGYLTEVKRVINTYKSIKPIERHFRARFLKFEGYMTSSSGMWSLNKYCHDNTALIDKSDKPERKNCGMVGQAVMRCIRVVWS